MLCLSYHWVMPEYLDFLFSFGHQEVPQDFFYNSFHFLSCIKSSPFQRATPNLGRSGQSYDLCYGLRAPERSQSQHEWPWSMRFCAIHHSFDTTSGQATWFILKANKLVAERIRASTTYPVNETGKYFASTDRALTSSLQIHLLLVRWSNEDWHSYVNFLERKFRNIAPHALSAKIQKAANPYTLRSSHSPPESPDSPILSTAPILERRLTHLSQSVLSQSPVEQLCQKDAQGPSLLATRSDQPLPPDYMEMKTRDASGDPRGISFDNLQDLQILEEKASEAILVLKSNLSIVTQLKECYQQIANLGHLDTELIGRSKDARTDFEENLSSVEHEIRLQIVRIEALEKLVANRKGFVSCDHLFRRKMCAD